MAGDVVHTLNAVDCLFDRRCDGAGDRLRRGTRVGGCDIDRRRDDVRILGYGQTDHGRQAKESDEDIDDDRKPRMFDEKMS